MTDTDGTPDRIDARRLDGNAAQAPSPTSSPST